MIYKKWTVVRLKGIIYPDYLLPKNTEAFLEEIRQNFNNFRLSALKKENYQHVYAS